MTIYPLCLPDAVVDADSISTVECHRGEIHRAPTEYVGWLRERKNRGKL